MTGRRRGPSRRRRKSPKQVKVPTNMYVADTTFDVSSLAALSNNLFTIFDNSGTAGNKTVRFTKLTIYWSYFGIDSIPVMVWWGRQKEGGVAVDIDDADAVRDYINDGHSLRGPYLVTTHAGRSGSGPSNASRRFKTMVFEGLVLDSNDDLVLHWTPLSVHSTAEKVHLFYKGFYRIVD